MKRGMILFTTVFWVLFCHNAFGKTSVFQMDVERLLQFDSHWQSSAERPFLREKDGFSVPVTIGAGNEIFFPSVLDAQSPISIHTKYGEVKQFLASDETYKAELVGRYLIYHGENNSILYRYDADKKALREFVFLTDSSSLSKEGGVVEWRFEGAELSPKQDGSVSLVRKSDPMGGIENVSHRGMADRISRFLAKRQGQIMTDRPMEKTLFIIPAPEYVDGNLTTRTQGIHYEVAENELKLVLNRESDFTFPLWVDPTLTADVDSDLTLNGQSANDFFGLSVDSAGDFNGDGVDDIIVGAFFDDNNGDASGSAFIFFGFQGQSQSTLVADADADVILNGQDAGDQFGISVASAGDFNGDGKGDVIVGARFDDNGGANSGSAFIFFGGVTGTKTADADADVILNGQSANDTFGWSVASAGDFNGDGIDDVIVGASGDDNAGTNSGSAFIFFGGVTGTKTADTDADVILNGKSGGDQFGFHVSSAGDFNGDGQDDVIVGAVLDDDSGECVDSNCNSGSAFIYFGGVTGTVNNPDTNADVALRGQSEGDLFGFRVASAGDFNGDGIDDVIVGARSDDNSGSSSGSAFIFFGGVTGTKIADADADVIISGQDVNDELGFHVASAGDFNGDGMDDVIVGAIGDDNSGADAGAAFILFGFQGQSQSSMVADVDADVVLNGQSAGDQFGAGVASAGDFDGDGNVDVIVGAPFDGKNGSNSGSAFLFFGTPASSSLATAEIDLEEFEVKARFRGRFAIEGYITLAEESNGVDPLTEDVMVVFDEYSETIPAGSFYQRGKKYLYKSGSFKGIRKMKIRDDGKFTIFAKRVDLREIDFEDPIPFSLQIGDDLGELDIVWKSDNDEVKHRWKHKLKHKRNHKWKYKWKHVKNHR